MHLRVEGNHDQEMGEETKRSNKRRQARAYRGLQHGHVPRGHIIQSILQKQRYAITVRVYSLTAERENVVLHTSTEWSLA
jgi:hypothetical protein